MSAEAWVTLGTGVALIVLQTIALIIGGVWALAKTEKALNEQVSEHKLETESRLNQTLREVGENFTAMRQKVTEVELYMRDHFVQKDAFQAIVSQIMSDMKSIGDRIETRLLRMESKIDRANHDGN